MVFPLAAAVLPDPLWIGGVYDGEDDDDLIAQSTDVGIDRPGRATSERSAPSVIGQ